MDQIYYNGNIITMDEHCPRAEAFLVRDGDFQQVGGRSLVEPRRPDAEYIDLEGKTVLPAFTESHMHVLSLGMFLRDVDLQHAQSIEHVIALSRAYIRDHAVAPGTWVRGRGWNQDNFQDESRFLTRYDLDKISTEHPIAFVRTCGHVIAVNSLALELVGMSETAPDVEGGRVDKDEQGKPLGIFREKARQIILGAIPEQSKEELKELIALASEEALAHGITTIHTDDFKDVPNNYQKVIDAYEEMERDGTLKIRIYEQCNLPSTEKISHFLKAGYYTGYGDEHFRLGPLKLLADGSLGSRTAYLRAPYSDQPGTRGIHLFSQEELDAMIGLAHKNGMQVAIHAIGDGAMDMVLHGIERAKREYPRQNERHGIIHCQITSPDQLDRMKALDLIAYIQPIFLNYDISIVEDRVGVERASTSYNWKEFVDKGIPIAGGSDCPVESLNILENIYTAVQRKTLKAQPEGGWRPDQSLTVREAVKSFTCTGAYASFEEARKGSITPGKMADFVVLPEDIFTIDPERLKDIQVERTYLDGVLVYHS